MHSIKKFFNEFIGEYPVLFFTILIVFIVALGTLSFHRAEWWDLFDSFYFTTVTMSTIGYGDMAPLTHGWKIVSIIYGFMWAPLFIGLTWLLFQTRFQKLIKHSIHAYHKEVKETEKITLEIEKENKKQDNKIRKIEKEMETK